MDNCFKNIFVLKKRPEQKKGRGTGETFRNILLALEEASAGGTVAYISKNKLSKRYFDFCNKIIEATGICTIKYSERTIEFPNGGKVYFIPNDCIEKICGLNFTKKILDH